MSKTLKIFVYGTLKVGGRFAPRFDKDRKSVQEATTRGTMFDTGWYPAVIFDDAGELKGELHEYENATDVERSFDSIEGCHGDNPNNLYNKKTIKVLVNGEEVECIAYEYNHSTDRMKRVENGFWEIDK